jgi:hypothetical protein
MVLISELDTIAKVAAVPLKLTPVAPVKFCSQDVQSAPRLAECGQRFDERPKTHRQSEDSAKVARSSPGGRPVQAPVSCLKESSDGNMSPGGFD